MSKKGLDCDLKIRDCVRSCQADSLVSNFSLDRKKEEHYIILDLITLATNSDKEHAKKCFDQTNSFLAFFVRSNEFYFCARAFNLVFNVWKYSFLKVLNCLYSGGDVSTMSRDLYLPLEVIQLEVASYVNHPDPAMRKLAKTRLINCNQRYEGEIKEYSR